MAEPRLPKAEARRLSFLAHKKAQIGIGPRRPGPAQTRGPTFTATHSHQRMQRPTPPPLPSCLVPLALLQAAMAHNHTPLRQTVGLAAVLVATLATHAYAGVCCANDNASDWDVELCESRGEQTCQYYSCHWQSGDVSCVSCACCCSLGQSSRRLFRRSLTFHAGAVCTYATAER